MLRLRRPTRIVCVAPCVCVCACPASEGTAGRQPQMRERGDGWRTRFSLRPRQLSNCAHERASARGELAMLTVGLTDASSSILDGVLAARDMILSVVP